MKNTIRIAAAVVLLAGLAGTARAQEFKTRLYKPDHTFFYYQANLHSGFETHGPGEGFGLARRGPRTQMSFEWFVKGERRMQQGYTRTVTPNAWNVKFALETMPLAGGFDDLQVGFRLLDTWVNVSTRWDRTSLRLGHRSLPYGHNPRIDGTMSFLPNQAGLDLGFGRDTGLFFKTPLSGTLDLELGASAGGFLAGMPVTLRFDDAGTTLDTHLKYRGSWLGSVRVGTPTFRRDEVGLFALAGTLHAEDGPLTRALRLGGDWVVKRHERWKFVNQLSAGTNHRGDLGTWRVANLLNSVELFYNHRFRLGMTHALRVEDLETPAGEHPFRGTFYGMISYVLTRDARFRINPFVEYRDATGERDAGVLFQLCVGCGLRK